MNIGLTTCPLAQPRRWVFIFCAITLVSTTAFPQPWSGKKEARTISTDSYQVIVQKNGHIGIHDPAEGVIFENVAPSVTIAGEESPRGLKLNQRQTTRFVVKEHIGEGQGMAFASKECDWLIGTFPGKPFVTARVTYHNASKKPVLVSRLSPWSVGMVSKGRYVNGANAAETRLLDNGSLFRGFNDYCQVTRGKITGQWNIAAVNPISGHVLVAGFLTNRRAYTEILMERTADSPTDAFDQFSADCVYDPPVEVPPGETLESETLYLGITEDNPILALDRYGKAYGISNDIRSTNSFLPHGWDSWNTRYHSDLNESVVMQNLDFLDKNLKRYGWTHFALDDGWQKGIGDWEPNMERFPNGMKAVADEIHKRGMTGSLWINPFAIDKNSALAKEHPEWLLQPKAGLGRIIIDDSKLILDVTRTEAYAWVRDLARKITQDWGFDAIVEADYVYFLLLAEGHYEKNLTNIEVLQKGMAALREGMGPDKLMTTMTPQPVDARFAEVIRTGFDNRPIWKTPNLKDPWGATDALTNTIRRFYMAPHVFRPDPDCAYFGHDATYERWGLKEKQPPLTREQSIAWLTGAALLGGTVKIGDAFVDLKQEEVNILRRLLPVPKRPARPLDLFSETSPRIWYLPMKETPSGDYYFVGLFNWDAATPIDIPISSARFGLDPNGYYTVYDFWAGVYRGTLHGDITVRVEPGSVRFFGLRPTTGKPVFVASDYHLLQGAMDQRTIVWDDTKASLSGDFDAIAETPYTLCFMAPDGYDLREAVVSCGIASTTQEGRAIMVRFNSGAGGPAKWMLRFK